MDEDAGRRERLLWSIRWLAADPDKALSAMDDPRMVPDEMALDFAHWLETARGYALVEGAALPLLTEIDEEFATFSGGENADEWTPEAMAASPRWAAQRERARRALALLGAERADDDLRGHV